MNIKNLHEKNFSSLGKTVFYNLAQTGSAGKNNFGIQNDEQFVLDFLREKHVLLVHGGGFNWANPDHFRIVYLPEVSVLTESMKKMDEFLEKYR